LRDPTPPDALDACSTSFSAHDHASHGQPIFAREAATSRRPRMSPATRGGDLGGHPPCASIRWRGRSEETHGGGMELAARRLLNGRKAMRISTSKPFSGATLLVACLVATVAIAVGCTTAPGAHATNGAHGTGGAGVGSAVTSGTTGGASTATAGSSGGG